MLGCFVYLEYTLCICGDEVLPIQATLCSIDSRDGLFSMVTMSLNYLT